MNPIHTLSDSDLLIRLRGTEHDFVERKPLGQRGDWLQVAVAFANSAPVGWPAVLFVGASDAGNPQESPDRLEDLAKKVNAALEYAYPSIYRDIRPVVTEGKGCLAVIIPGSENRPHFAGKAYIRNGPEVKEASDQQFAELVGSRNSKVREIQNWTGKQISLTAKRRSGSDRHYRDSTYNESIKIQGCNAHFATFGASDEVEKRVVRIWSEPLGRITLGYDNVRDRLWLYIYEDR